MTQTAIEKNEKASLKKELSIQEYLSLGYIYLLILGIITEAIFYNFIGINILGYSTILDVLISPIKIITGNIFLLLFMSLIVFVVFIYQKFILPKLQKTKSYQNLNSLTTGGMMLISGALFLVLFLGIGVGRGLKIRSQMEKGQLESDHVITFNNLRNINAKVIGQNSLYLFYVPENDTEVFISPINNSILQIKKVNF